MELTITNSTENFESWIKKSFITDNLRDILSKSSILIVPFDNLRESQNPFMFPIGTEEIFRYFKEKLPEDQLIDICISNEYYQEFAFFNDYKRLGNFIIKSVVVQVFVGIMCSYIYDKFIKEDDSKPKIEVIDNSTHININNHISTLADKKYLEPTHIKFSVTIVDKVGNSKNISYEGPATNIDNVLKTLKEYEEE